MFIVTALRYCSACASDSNGPTGPVSEWTLEAWSQRWYNPISSGRRLAGDISAARHGSRSSLYAHAASLTHARISWDSVYHIIPFSYVVSYVSSGIAVRWWCGRVTLITTAARQLSLALYTYSSRSLQIFITKVQVASCILAVGLLTVRAMWTFPLEACVLNLIVSSLVQFMWYGRSFRHGCFNVGHSLKALPGPSPQAHRWT